MITADVQETSEEEDVGLFLWSVQIVSEFLSFVKTRETQKLFTLLRKKVPILPLRLGAGSPWRKTSTCTVEDAESVSSQ